MTETATVSLAAIREDVVSSLKAAQTGLVELQNYTKPLSPERQQLRRSWNDLALVIGRMKA